MAAKQHRRGVSFPFRLIIAASAFLLQIALLAGLVYSLSGRAVWVYVGFELISITIVIYIINQKGNPSYKITWLIFILIFPLIGGLVYLVWGGNRVFPHLRKRMTASEKARDPYLVQKKSVENRLEYADLLHARQSRYLRNESGFPVYDHTSAEYISPGEAVLPRLLEELEKAEHYIFLEFFILAEGVMWDSVHRILTRKAAEGLDIRVIFDDFGSITRQYRGFIRGLRAEGIKAATFNPIRPSADIFMNNRNHRKIVIVDGKTALTGGINIGDEYVNLIHPHGYWMDCGIIFKGDAVRSFLVMFCNMWCFITSKKMDMEPLLPDCPVEAEGFVQPYCDGPLNGCNPAEGIYMQILNTAQRYVYIASPYLILDNEMITVLSLAAKSGIDVRVVTPAVWDKWYVHPVTQYYYEELLEAGVRIFEYTPGFLHSKLFVSDDQVATVGSVNMDYRSFYFHFECGAWLCGSEAVRDVRDDVIRMMQVGQEIRLAEWRRRPLRLRLKQGFLHLFAPFM